MLNTAVYRILDANLNRLREALRVIEEQYRFSENSETVSVRMKVLRHSVSALEKGFDRDALLRARDTGSDCFANENRPEELGRTSAEDIVRASFKRAQEASRVIEEYSKLDADPALSEGAKTIRFTLYSMEKEFLTH